MDQYSEHYFSAINSFYLATLSFLANVVPLSKKFDPTLLREFFQTLAALVGSVKVTHGAISLIAFSFLFFFLP